MGIEYWVVMAVLIPVMLIGGYFVQKRFFHGGPNLAQRRWEWIGGPISIIWVVSLIFLGNAIKENRTSIPPFLGVGISVIALSGLAFVWWMYRWLQKADEMIRKAEIEALALGFGISLVFFTTVDLLANTVAPSLGNTVPGLRLVYPFCMAYGIGRVFVYLRYR